MMARAILAAALGAATGASAAAAAGPPAADTSLFSADSPPITGLPNERDAGQELFVLATNFLLYVALVVITMLLQKFYFPETLQKAKPVPAELAAQARRRALF